MDIRFFNPGADAIMESILGFQSDEESDFWTRPLYSFYPQLNQEQARKLPFAERKEYIEKGMRAVYAEQEAILNQKASAYAAQWQEDREPITSALSDAFDTDCVMLFNDLRCGVSLNPIEPRFLTERRFDVFYLNSPRGAMGESIHEMIHFVWFHVWNQVFHDGYAAYERPSLQWIMSEMVVESIMRDKRLSERSPYFPREDGGCVYPYFFTLNTTDGPALEVLDQMYRGKPIRAFMKDGFAWCRAHEQEIRAHIREAEEATNQ